jgi:hypothetical protein
LHSGTYKVVLVPLYWKGIFGGSVVMMDSFFIFAPPAAAFAETGSEKFFP